MKTGLILLAFAALALGEVAFSRSALRKSGEPGENVLIPTDLNASLDTSLKYTPNGIKGPNSTAVIPQENWAVSADDGGVIPVAVTDESGASEAFFGKPKGPAESTPEKVLGSDPIQPL